MRATRDFNKRVSTAPRGGTTWIFSLLSTVLPTLCGFTVSILSNAMAETSEVSHLSQRPLNISLSNTIQKSFVNGSEPDPSTLTVRFKNGRTTVLVFVSKSEPFRKAKENLLHGLRESGHSTLNGASVPDSADMVEIAVPVDRHDISKGWKALEGPDAEDRLMSQTRSDQHSGLRDNGMVAFRFRGANNSAGWDVRVASMQDADAERMDQS
jgi:hypothetical protein